MWLIHTLPFLKHNAYISRSKILGVRESKEQQGGMILEQSYH